MKVPWSSSGTNAPGVSLNINTVATIIEPIVKQEDLTCLVKNETVATYLSVRLAKALSNHTKNLFSLNLIRFAFCLLLSRKITHKAGVKVKAQTPEITTETAIVIANCLYIVPASPPMNPTGTNTAHKTKTIAISAPVTSSIALIVASRTESPSVDMIRSTFSITTIASSTTIPIASTNPNNVRVFIENPAIIIPAKAPIIDTGTAKHGIKVARNFFKNTKITNTTNKIASKRV